MKIAFVVPKHIYDTKMSRVRFQQWDAIADSALCHGSAITGPGWPNWDDTRSAAANIDAIRLGDDTPELVVTYKAGKLHGLSQPVVIQFNEADDHTKTLAEIADAQPSMIVFHHANDLPQYRHLQTNASPAWSPIGHPLLVHLPHCADNTVYHDYQEPKTIDVLCAGNMSQAFYPFRYRLMRIARDILRKRGYNVVVLPHPGYTLPAREGTVTGHAFARMLNSSKLVFTCSMRFKYALAKYSEIALCRSLAVGDIPDERQDFFRDTILNVEPTMTDDEIVRIVEDVLDDDAKREKLTTRSYDLNTRTSTMEHYALRFIQEARRLFTV